MHSSAAVSEVKSQQQHARPSEAEMKIVEEARAESRKEAAALEQMKQHLREAFLSGAAATAEDFERCWPELRNELFRCQAHHGMLMYRAAEQR